MATIWVRVPDHPDPGCRGRERRRKPGEGPSRYFTAKPEQVEESPAIARLLLTGDLVRVDAPEE